MSEASPGAPSPTPPEGGAGSHPSQGAPTLTFRGGGWVIVLAALLTLGVLLWGVLAPLLGVRPIGDGQSVPSYGYDLSTLLVESDQLVGSGRPRGFLPSLDDPKHLEGRLMASFNVEERPKYVVPTDRVAGVVIDGKPHAWPLSMLNAHEVVNDTVAGVPVVTTYSPLCDAVVVFDRRVAGAVRRFEVSGLLVDSNLVFVDKLAEPMASPAGSPGGVSAPGPHVPSLFLQLERRAIAGPLAAAGVRLEPLPGVCITTWEDWLSAHPGTTVTLRDPTRIRHMKEISYARYFLDRELLAPVAPLPDDATLASNGLRLKSPMTALEVDGQWHLVGLEALLREAQGVAPELPRTARFSVGGTDFIAHLPKGPAVCRIERADGQPATSIPCLYFAANALLGGALAPSAAAR